MKKNDSVKMSSAFLERLKSASYCSMTSLEKISSNPFRRKMCNSESVPEVYQPPDNQDDIPLRGISCGVGSDYNNDLTQCYSVTTGKVSTLVRAPSFSSLSSIEVAEINNSNGVSSKGSNARPSAIHRDFSSLQVNVPILCENLSNDAKYLTVPSTLSSTNRKKKDIHVGTRTTSPVIKRSRVVRTQHHELCTQCIARYVLSLNYK